MICRGTLQGPNISHPKGTFEHVFSLPKVGYVSSLEGGYVSSLEGIQNIQIYIYLDVSQKEGTKMNPSLWRKTSVFLR